MVATAARKNTKKIDVNPEEVRESRLKFLESFAEGDRVYCQLTGRYGTYKGIQDLPMPDAWVIFDDKQIHEPVSPRNLIKQPAWKEGDKLIHTTLGSGVAFEVCGHCSKVDFGGKDEIFYHNFLDGSLKLAPVFDSDIKVSDEVTTVEFPGEIYKVVHIEEGQASLRRLESENPDNNPETRQLPLWHLAKVECEPSYPKVVEKTTLEELLDGSARIVPSPLVESIEGANGDWINLFSGHSLKDCEVSWIKAPVQQPANSFDIPEDFDGEALSREEVEKLIERIVETSESIKSLALFAKNFTRYALVVIDSREGYKAYECDSMSQFLEDYSHLFKKAYSSLQKEWQAGRLEYDLGFKIGTLPETQARELYPLKENLDDCRKAWESACEKAESENRKVKSADIGTAVREVLNLPQPPKKIKTKCTWVPGPNATRHYKVSLYGKEINLHDTFDAHAVALERFAEIRRQAPEEIILDGLLGALGEALGVGNPGAVAAAIDFLKRKEIAA